MLNMLRDKKFQGTEAWKKFYQYSANKDNELFSEKLKLILIKQVIGIAESANVIHQWLCITKPSTSDSIEG